MQFRRANNLLTLLLAALSGAGMSGAVRAEVLDEMLGSARPRAEGQGVFQLSARVTYPVNDDIRAALKDGLMLNFDLDAAMSRERRF